MNALVAEYPESEPEVCTSIVLHEFGAKSNKMTASDGIITDLDKLSKDDLLFISSQESDSCKVGSTANMQAKRQIIKGFIKKAECENKRPTLLDLGYKSIRNLDTHRGVNTLAPWTC